MPTSSIHEGGGEEKEMAKIGYAIREPKQTERGWGRGRGTFRFVYPTSLSEGKGEKCGVEVSPSDFLKLRRRRKKEEKG